MSRSVARGVMAMFCGALMLVSSSAAQAPKHTFAIGDQDFLLDGQPFVIRSGELHAPRIPPEYWRHRLQMVRALGCNTVCAYLFWNQHEPQPGRFDFTGAADAAAYCRIAQEEGLWVILRPGPYSCAEWEFGGFPWWLLKTPDLKLRTRDPHYLDAAKRYLLRVGQELAPLQITRGGPIIMVQVENEYGSYGNDKEYVGILRDDLRAAGFDVPLFTCDGPSQLKNDTRDDLFCVVNFGSDPERNFAALRKVRPAGPLMCGEFYPGWFDSWGAPHHTGNTPRTVGDLRWMLEHRASFSIYMVHGGTSFRFTSGANCPPFSPQTTSYDYDAPIDEAGRPAPKFAAIRELFGQHLQPGETLPAIPPPPLPIAALPDIRFTQYTSLFEHLGTPRKDDLPHAMEQYDQGLGCILYRTTVPAGGAGELAIREAHDYAQVYLDGQRIGRLDRRHRGDSVKLPARAQPQRLDILVEAMGRVNYGEFLHDRKGITESVTLSEAGKPTELKNWEVFNLPLDSAFLASLHYADAAPAANMPAIYRAEFDVAQPADTFLDLRTWEKGFVWVNGHNLGRYWNIGPQQTLYLPGCWLKPGRNEIVVLDLTGGAQERVVRGLAEPILNEVRDDPLSPPRARKPGQTLKLDGVEPVAQGAFKPGKETQVVRFAPTPGRYVCLEALNSDPDDAFTTCAELYLLGEDGKDLPRDGWTIAYADSEERAAEDGAAWCVLDGQTDTFWHTQWQGAAPPHPHQIVLDLGTVQTIAGLRYVPRQDLPHGRIKDYRVYIRRDMFPGL